MAKAVKAAKKHRVNCAGIFSGIESISFDCVLMTKELAQHMLDTMTYAGQRPPSNVLVTQHSHSLEDGYFYPCTPIVLGTCGKTTSLLDAHHRLTAIAETGISTYVEIKTYHCKTMAQLHRLYVLFDSGIGKRNKDAMFMALFGKKATSKIPVKQVTRLVSAARVIINCFSQSYARVQSYNVLALLECAKKFLPSMLTFLEITEGMSRQGLRRETLLSQSVLAVALVTLEWSPELAHDFWVGVAHNGSKRKNDPRASTRDTLADLQHVNSRNPFNHRKGSQRFTPREISHITAWGWNHHHDGKPLREMGVEAAASNGQIWIKGTPWRLSISSEEFAKEVKAYGIGGAHAVNMPSFVRRSATHYKPSAAKGATNVAVAVEVS